MDIHVGECMWGNYRWRSVSTVSQEDAKQSILADLADLVREDPTVMLDAEEWWDWVGGEVRTVKPGEVWAE